MKHIGVIAEYNPFHKGHAYQLSKVNELFPDKKIIVLMSGNYVQRGEPAIFNKYLRTQCALSDKVDIIFELPLLYATASAEYFASSAIIAFQKMGVVDMICFGAESDNLPILQEIAHVLATEPGFYKDLLQKELKKGSSFPKARMAATSAYLNHTEIEQIMQQPNNILAIEYLKAIERYKVAITPVVIKRIGSGYHDTGITDNFSSATAIRKSLLTSTTDINSAIPEKSVHILQNTYNAKPLFMTDFYDNIQYALWKEASHLEQYLDVSQSLANQLRTHSPYSQTIDELLHVLSSKNYTTTRIRRVLLNILLNIKKSDMDYYKNNGYITYLRLLGFQKNASTILKTMKDCCTIPIINKVADANTILSETDYSYFQKELHQNHLYTQIFYKKYGIRIPSEYEHSVIISE